MSTMNFSTEAELQDFLHRCLGGQCEVWLNPSCRIDIVTQDFQIEVKLVLSRSAMDRAAGQLCRYSPYAAGRTQVIAGCAPKNFGATHLKMAESFRDAGIQVWFVDLDPHFQQAYRQLNSEISPVRQRVLPTPVALGRKKSLIDRIVERLFNFN